MINSGLFSSKTNEWATPLALFKELDQEFGFTLDPCATPQNAKCKKFYTLEDDGLKQNWGGASGVLQSSLRQRDRQMGGEMLQGGTERCAGGGTHTSKDRYQILPRVCLEESKRDKIFEREAAF